MAYQCQGTSCTRVLHFSTGDSSIKYANKVVGSPSQDNAKEINNNKLTVANFRKKGQSTTNSDAQAAPLPFEVCGWNYVPFEVEVVTGDVDPKNLSWKLVNIQFPNGRPLVRSGDYTERQATSITRTCIFAGACFDFTIQPGGAVQSFKVRIGGQEVATGYNNGFTSEVHRLKVDATVKKASRRRCKWLANKPQYKIRNECDRRDLDFSKFCPKTCGSC